MFVKVEPDELLPNHKYKIEVGDRVWVGYYKGTRESVEFVYRGTMYSVLPYRNFYKFISDNPRWKMERRAVNIVIRNILGDHYFEW